MMKHLKGMSWRNLPHWSAVAIGMLLLLLPINASGQYFGRNKVQYEDFDFKVLRTEHFEVYFYPAESEAAHDAARMLERWYQRFNRVFQHAFKEPQPIVVYADHPDFQQTNVISGLIPQGVRGVTEGLKNRIVLPFAGIYKDNDHVLGHELVHAFQFSIMKSRKKGFVVTNEMPLWFVEGMAEYLSIGPKDPLTAMWMRDAVLHEDLPTIGKVSRDQKYFPYRYGHAIWAYLAGTWGDSTVAKLYYSVLADGWQQGFSNIIGVDIDSLSKDWQHVTRQTYGPQLVGRTKPSEAGERIVAGQGGTNLAPAISPDGRQVVFLSRRGLFSLDLYLADAQTGRITKKLVSSDTDAHFDALSFMNSAGSWSPDSRRFAFVVLEKGNNEIAILDVPSRKIERTFRIQNVDEITHLTWSPDGHHMALSGTSGGTSDLYLLELNNDTIRQLTNDRHADIQPAWSPDGKILAFATDRGGGTDFDELVFEPLKIGLYNLETEQIQLISMTDSAKHINPQFSSQGRDLYFVADPDGFSDLYRYSLDAQEFYRVTHIATGISGLTALSPAMTVSQNTGRVVFSVFEDAEYNIYALDPEQAEGILFSPDDAGYMANVSLPPVVDEHQGVVEGYLMEPEAGLVPHSELSLSDYKPKLQPIYVGQSTIGVSFDRFGTQFGGSTSIYFSDLLGDHMLGVALQAGGDIKDLGGEVLYQNLRKRVNWGLSASHIPYLTAYMASGVVTVTDGNQQFLARELLLLNQRVYLDRLNLFAEYPFTMNRRTELGLGFTRISYDVEAERLLTTFDGIVLEKEEIDVDDPSGLNLVHANLAYVGDYSFFGFTSPIKGRRFRFQVEPTFGSLQYLTLLADYRRYHFWRPMTLAWRLLHQGRYLGDSESPQLTSLLLGYETWVRGYSLESFDLSECTETEDPNKCPEFDRLVGSRAGVMNVELRLPVFGNEELGLINYPFIPMDLVAFLDGGVAWTKYEKPVWKLATRSTDRVPVFSAGLAARFNLFGYLVWQVYYAYPFQRPDKGAHFGFLISPGW